MDLFKFIYFNESKVRVTRKQRTKIKPWRECLTPNGPNRDLHNIHNHKSIDNIRHINVSHEQDQSAAARSVPSAPKCCQNLRYVWIFQVHFRLISTKVYATIRSYSIDVSFGFCVNIYGYCIIILVTKPLYMDFIFYYFVTNWWKLMIMKF